MTCHLLDFPLELVVHVLALTGCPCDVIQAARACHILRCAANLLLADQAATVMRAAPRPLEASNKGKVGTVRAVKSLTHLAVSQQYQLRTAGRVVTCDTHNPGDPRNSDLVSIAPMKAAALMHCFPDWTYLRAFTVDYRSACTIRTGQRSSKRSNATGIESLDCITALTNLTHLTLYSTEACIDSAFALIHHLAPQLLHLNMRDASSGELDLSHCEFPRLKSLFINVLGVVHLPTRLPALTTFECYALHAETLLARIARCAPQLSSIQLREPFGCDCPVAGFEHPWALGSSLSDSDSVSVASSDESDENELSRTLVQRVWSPIVLPHTLRNLSLPPNVRFTKLNASPHVLHLETDGHRLSSGSANTFPNLTSLVLSELTLPTLKALQNCSFSSSLTHLTIRNALFDLIHVHPRPFLRFPHLVYAHADQDLFLCANLAAPNLTSVVIDLQGARDPEPSILARVLAVHPCLSRVKIEWLAAWARDAPPRLVLDLSQHDQAELGISVLPTPGSLARRLTHLDIPSGFMYLVDKCPQLREMTIRVQAIQPTIDCSALSIAKSPFDMLTALTMVAEDLTAPIQVDAGDILLLTLSEMCPRLSSFSLLGCLDFNGAQSNNNKAPLRIAWNGAFGPWQWSSLFRLAAGVSWQADVQRRAARNGLVVAITNSRSVDPQIMLDGLSRLVGHGFREKLSVAQRKRMGSVVFQVGQGEKLGGLQMIMERLKRCHYPCTVVTV